MWLAEAFGNFTLEWSSRKDLTPRTYKMVKLEPEIKALESFSKRAYTAELTEQRLLINDLFGGTSPFPHNILSHTDETKEHRISSSKTSHRGNTHWMRVSIQ